MQSVSATQERPADEPKGKSVLSFRPIGKPIPIDEVPQAYREMAEEYGKPVTPEAMARVGAKSGSHLLKLISPRAAGDQSVMRLPATDSNREPKLIPSVNAADIPVAKIAFRPLEVLGQPTRNLVQHILNPDDVSDHVTEAFASVFGADVLNALKAALSAAPAPITRLPGAEFPIVFLPNPAGGDLQATPVAPAAAYMDMRDVIAPYYRKQEKDGPKVPRGCWSRQAISAKPQNISGAIGGPRIRFHARFPQTLQRIKAEIYRFASGGRFPRMNREDAAEAAERVLRYADLLAREAEHSNQDIRNGLDNLADWMIAEAIGFIEEVMGEAVQLKPDATNLKTPSPGEVLLDCRYERNDDRLRARQVLSGPHFRSRVTLIEDRP